jgi:threonine dehydrogenase-like Zn-dependent dehydrogenase
VIEAAGARGTLQQAVELSQSGGTILSLGGCTAPDTIVPMLAMWKEVKILFSAAYGTADFHHALDTLDAGEVAPRAMVGETIPLEVLPERFESMRSRSHPAKVMVDLTT